jgi:hypothetical protein
MPSRRGGICGRFDLRFALNSTPGWVLRVLGEVAGGAERDGEEIRVRRRVSVRERASVREKVSVCERVSVQERVFV